MVALRMTATELVVQSERVLLRLTPETCLSDLHIPDTLVH
jgi:hypothetical protein